jgi:hypothetical protein
LENLTLCKLPNLSRPYWMKTRKTKRGWVVYFKDRFDSWIRVERNLFERVECFCFACTQDYGDDLYYSTICRHRLYFDSEEEAQAFLNKYKHEVNNA